MSAVVEVPLELVEAVADLRLPPKTDQWLQTLMDRNTEGTLTSAEREELEALVEWSERVALVRARALHLLGRKPTGILPGPNSHVGLRPARGSAANTAGCTRRYREQPFTSNMSRPVREAAPMTWGTWPGLARGATCEKQTGPTSPNQPPAPWCLYSIRGRNGGATTFGSTASGWREGRPLDGPRSMPWN